MNVVLKLSLVAIIGALLVVSFGYDYSKSDDHIKFLWYQYILLALGGGILAIIVYNSDLVIKLIYVFWYRTLRHRFTFVYHKKFWKLNGYEGLLHLSWISFALSLFFLSATFLPGLVIRDSQTYSQKFQSLLIADLYSICAVGLCDFVIICVVNMFWNHRDLETYIEESKKKLKETNPWGYLLQTLKETKHVKDEAKAFFNDPDVRKFVFEKLAYVHQHRVILVLLYTMAGMIIGYLFFDRLIISTGIGFMLSFIHHEIATIHFKKSESVESEIKS